MIASVVAAAEKILLVTGRLDISLVILGAKANNADTAFVLAPSLLDATELLLVYRKSFARIIIDDRLLAEDPVGYGTLSDLAKGKICCLCFHGGAEGATGKTVAEFISDKATIAPTPLTPLSPDQSVYFHPLLTPTKTSTEERQLTTVLAGAEA